MAASESHCESMPAETEKSAMELRYHTEDGHEQEIAPTQEKAGRKLGFLSLPGEIRNEIYAYVFGPGEWSVWNQMSFKTTRRDQASIPQEYPLALLETCKTVHAEAFKLPFMLGTFTFTTDMLYPRDSYPYGQFFAKSINVVESELGVPYYEQSHPWYAPNLDGLLNQFPSLENIHIYDIYGKETYEDERDWYEKKGYEFLNVILAHPSNASVSLTINAGEDSELVAKMRNRAEIFDRIWAYP